MYYFTLRVPPPSRCFFSPQTQGREPAISLGSLPSRRSLNQDENPKPGHPNESHKGGNRKHVVELCHNLDSLSISYLQYNHFPPRVKKNSALKENFYAVLMPFSFTMSLPALFSAESFVYIKTHPYLTMSIAHHCPALYPYCTRIARYCSLFHVGAPLWPASSLHPYQSLPTSFYLPTYCTLYKKKKKY